MNEYGGFPVQLYFKKTADHPLPISGIEKLKTKPVVNGELSIVSGEKWDKDEVWKERH